MKAILLATLVIFSSIASAEPLRVFAAASLTEALSKVADAYNVRDKIVFNFDASSKLAQQLKSGAPADLFFSADTEWMEFLEKNEKILAGSRKDLLSNRLVLIVPEKAKAIPAKAPDLLDGKYYARIALAGEAVPAGKFGRAALSHEGVDIKKLTGKIASADNVKVALKWVALGEAEAGIVYETDAKVETKVKTAFIFPEASHPKIIYPAAIINNSKNPEAKKFLDFCSSGEGKEIFRKMGFITL